MNNTVSDSLSTRDRLVMKAAELLMQQSYGAVSVEDICKAADIKKGTFYHYFPSKTDLAVAAYDWKWNSFEPALEECFAPHLSPLEQLQRYAALGYAFQKQHFETAGKICGCPHTSAAQEMGTQDERIREKLKEIFDRHCAFLARCLAQMPAHAARTPEKQYELACEMLSFSSGVMCQAKVMNDLEVIRQQMLPGLCRLAGVDDTSLVTG